MIEWREDGIVLGQRAFGENKLIVSLFTPTHGRTGGVLKLTKAGRLQGVAQPGNRVHIHWKARLEEHLGYVSLDVKESLAGLVLSNHAKLLTLSAAGCLTNAVFPDRHPYPRVYERLDQLLDSLKTDHFIESYVHFEHTVLQEMGFGLKLRECCVSGDTENLAYVSPKTGRAVSQREGAAYHDKLLGLPPFLLEDAKQAQSFEEICQGFHLMAHFFHKQMTENSYAKVMGVRTQLLQALEKKIRTTV